MVIPLSIKLMRTYAAILEAVIREEEECFRLVGLTESLDPHIKQRALQPTLPT